MRGERNRLCAKTRSILAMIAAGKGYEQILMANPEWTHFDIFDAAEEALGNGDSAQDGRAYTLAEKRERHSRAYERWSEDEDNTLRELVRSGMTVSRISGQLQRIRGGIRSRIVKLGLVSELIPSEQERLRRILGEERRDREE